MAIDQLFTSVGAPFAMVIVFMTAGGKALIQWYKDLKAEIQRLLSEKTELLRDKMILTADVARLESENTALKNEIERLKNVEGKKT